MRLRAAFAVFFCVSLTLSGCMLDFDQFDEQTGPLGDTGDVGDAGTLPDGAPPGDAVDGSDSSNAPVIGSACSSDSDCETGGMCSDGYCTQNCSADSDCPSGSSCHILGGQTLCLADCNMEQSCEGVASRDDLSCATLVGDVDFGARPRASRACVVDADGDSVADVVDNCADAANATQSDRDGDGAGDACDTEPLCHSAAQDGLLDYGAATYEPTNFSIPETTSLNWLPIVGGVDAEGNDVASMAVIDRASGSWADASELPYAAGGRAVAATTANRYLITPGVLEDGQPEFGDYLLVERDGTTSFGPAYSSTLHDKTLVSSGLGYLFAHGYTTDASSTTNEWRVDVFDSASGQFQTVETGADSDRVEWHATVDLRGNVIFYSKVQPTINVMRLVQLDPQGRLLQTMNLSLPAREPPATGQFDPFLVPGPGNMMYAFDRAVGAAVRIDMDSRAITGVSEFSLNLGTSSARFIAVPGSPSFITLDRSSSDPTQLVASEYFVPCLPGTSARDDDSDGVGDITDNCPSVENADQADADNDTVGDVCDPDADNDGVPDASDATLADDQVTEISFALDTDNDGVDNTDDDDDDQDSIADKGDRMPFDTDNDGLYNGLDPDDDDDGYSDAEEAAAGSDTLVATSFPGIGTLSWVREAANSQSLEYAPLDALSESTSLPLDGAAVHRPRFVGDGSLMFALAGEPGSATGVHLISTDPGAETPVQTFDVGRTLRGADPAGGLSAEGSLSTIIASFLDDTTGAWQLGHINVADLSATPLVTMFGDVWSPRVAGTHVAFLAAPASCEPCVRPYVVTTTGGTPQAVTSSLEAPRSLRYDGSRYLVVAKASDGRGTSGYVISGQGITEVRPPGVNEVNSLVAVGGAGHFVVSGRVDSQSNFELWLYNARARRWHLISSTDEDLIEVDWIASVPPPPEEPSNPDEPL